MNEDYCSYELSKILKTCGFDEPCRYYYTSNKKLRIVKDNALAPEIINNRYLDEICDGCCTAVPLWQAKKWLLEKHRISVRMNYFSDVELWFVDWLKLDSEEFGDANTLFATYKEALVYGIAAALELIKKGGL